jgi:hypothetical protein
VTVGLVRALLSALPKLSPLLSHIASRLVPMGFTSANDYHRQRQEVAFLTTGGEICLLSVACCLPLSAVCCLLSVVACQLSCCLLSVVGYLLLALCSLWSTFRRLLAFHSGPPPPPTPSLFTSTNSPGCVPHHRIQGAGQIVGRRSI